MKIPFIYLLKGIEWLQLYYETNYIYAPFERLADFYSYCEMISVSTYISESVPNLIEFFQIHELKNLVKGYKDENGNLISPTLKYIHGLGMDKYLVKFPWYNEDDFNALNEFYKSKFSLEERLIYGFPIEKEEYNHTLDVLKRSRFFK